jgi:hypothetical protein
MMRDADEEAGERYEDLFLERPNYAVMETADYLPQFVGKPPNFAPGSRQGERSRNCPVGCADDRGGRSTRETCHNEARRREEVRCRLVEYQGIGNPHVPTNGASIRGCESRAYRTRTRFACRRPRCGHARAQSP